MEPSIKLLVEGGVIKSHSFVSSETVGVLGLELTERISKSLGNSVFSPYLIPELSLETPESDGDENEEPAENVIELRSVRFNKVFQKLALIYPSVPSEDAASVIVMPVLESPALSSKSQDAKGCHILDVMAEVHYCQNARSKPNGSYFEVRRLSIVTSGPGFPDPSLLSTEAILSLVIDGLRTELEAALRNGCNIEQNCQIR